MSVDKVLIVDDSATERALLSDLLRKNGFTPLTASNGEEAINTAKEQLPDLILMDIVMPEMNGFEATRAISRQTETSEIPIVLVSSKGQETDKVWGMRQGATDYIVKPLTEKSLIEKLGKF